MKDTSIIPAGLYCYKVVRLKDGEILSRDIKCFGKDLREYPYRDGWKEVLCPYWYRTEYGMIRCDFLEIESLDEGDDGAKSKAIAHYGSLEDFNKVNVPTDLYDECKKCKVKLEDEEEE